MREKSLFKYIAVFAVLFIFALTNGVNDAQAEEIGTEPIKPYIHIYDAQDNLIKEYTDSEINVLMQQQNKAATYVSALANKTYGFGATTFSSNIWVNGGSSFYNPLSIGIDTAKAFEKLNIVLYQSGSKVGMVDVGGFVNGVDVPLTWAYKYSGHYAIQLANASTSSPKIPISLRPGYVIYQ